MSSWLGGWNWSNRNAATLLDYSLHLLCEATPTQNSAKYIHALGSIASGIGWWLTEVRSLRAKEGRASMASLARRLLRRSERNTLAQKLRLWLESSGSHRELLLQVDRKGP